MSVSNMLVSIEHQFQRIRKQFKSEIADMQKSRNNLDIILKRIIDITKFTEKYEYLDNPRCYTLLYLYFLFKRDFEFAWILAAYSRIGYLKPHEEVWPYFFDSITNADLPFLGSAKIGHGSGKLPCGGMPEFFRNDDEPFNERKRKERLVGAVECHGVPIYDFRPEARYLTIHETPNFYMSYESYLSSTMILGILMAQDKLDEVEECIFRLRHILSLGEAPKHLMNAKKHRMLAPQVNAYDYWLQARRASDPERQKLLAWTALFWFLEWGLRWHGKDVMAPHFFDTCCGIIAEFELFGPDQEDFLKNFKVLAANASMSICHKMIEDPTPIIEFSERKGLPNATEFAKMYFERYPKA